MSDNPTVNKAESADDQSRVAELLGGIADKNPAALEQLYNSHSGILMSVISSVINVRAEAEDVLQETFITIWKKAGKYNANLGKPVSWLVTVAKNKAYDRYRSLVRKTEGQAKVTEEISANKGDFVEAKNYKNEAIREVMNQLTDDQKEAIELIFFDGLTQKEVSEQLEIPLGTVKARTRRGLIALKNNILTD